MKRLLLLVLLLSLPACTTFSKKECEAMNWDSIGYDTALEGKSPASPISYYQRNCTEEHGVAVDRESFMRGHKAGINDVCTAEGGRRFGARGHYYAGFCPKEKEVVFKQAYTSGRFEYLEDRVSQLEREVESLKSDNSSKASRISGLESDLRRKESEISSLESKLNHR